MILTVSRVALEALNRGDLLSSSFQPMLLHHPPPARKWRPSRGREEKPGLRADSSTLLTPQRSLVREGEGALLEAKKWTMLRAGLSSARMSPREGTGPFH